MCLKCSSLVAEFSIASRLYAEAAARVGASGGILLDYPRLITEAEDALHRSQAACASLKEHVNSHRSLAAMQAAP